MARPLAAVLLATLAVRAQNDPDALAALRKLGDRLKDAKTLSAHVVQSRKTALLEEPLVSSGTLFYRREPPELVFHLTVPKTSVIHLDRSAYQVYRPDEKRLERFEFEDPSVSGKLLMAFQPKPDEIGKAFSTRKGPSRAGEVEIVLEPTDEKVKKRIARLTLLLDEKDWILKRIATVDADGDEVTFDLSGVTVDPPLDPSLFELKVPEGTRVLKHSAKLEK
jgi:outer membrane lipoprotein-sorting protein